MKFKTILLMLILISLVYADQTEDLRFAIGLYRDENFDLAEQELENFLKKYPDSEYFNDALYLLGNIKLARKEVDEAEKIYLELQKINLAPTIESNVLLGLGQARFYLNKLNRAKQHLSNFITRYPTHDDLWKAHLFLAKISLSSDKLTDAEAYLQKAEDRSEDLQIYLTGFQIYKRQNDFNKTKESIRKILEREKNEEVYRIFAEYLQFCLQQKKYEEIIEYKDFVKDLETNYKEQINLFLGIAQYNLHRNEQAHQILKTLEMERAKYYNAMSLYELQKIPQARSLLDQLKTSENSEIAANALFYLAKIEPDHRKAIELLTNFLQKNQNHKFEPIAQYLSGFHHFRLNEYERAIEMFNAAEPKIRSLPVEYEKLLFLKAEAKFLQNDLAGSESSFESYLKTFPAGKFVDEAIFKMGLISYKQKKFEKSSVEFSRLVNNHPESAKVAMSHFYLAEIMLEKLELQKAEIEYRKAMQGKSDLAVIWERIAYIKYRTQDYEAALDALKNVPDDKIYDKNLLRGKIYFAQRNYSKAVDAFSFAADGAATQQKKEAALSQKAWTLYKMKKFDEASEIYAQLATSTGSTEDYLFKSASAAFSAEDYERAIRLFSRYNDKFPAARKKAAAELSIADAYYNLGNYQQAVEYYRQLISPESEEKILNNALNGLRWSAEQDKKIDFLQEITSLLNAHNNKDFIIKLLDRKIHYEYKNELYENVIESAKKIEILDSEYEKIAEIILLKAVSLSELEQFREAEKEFSRLSDSHPTSEVYLQWAQLLLEQEKFDVAIEKLRKASMLTRRDDIWLLLLETEQKKNSRFFRNDFYKYMEFAKGEERQQAELMMLEEKIKIQDVESIEMLNTLLNSEFKSVKAKAQYLKGLDLYLKRNYEAAIPELLRVRYLYPEFTEIQIWAEAYACLAYLRTGDRDNAENIYDTIKDDVPGELKKEIEALFEQGGSDE